jgi:hypothetical protein
MTCVNSSHEIGIDSYKVNFKKLWCFTHSKFNVESWNQWEKTLNSWNWYVTQ